MSEAKAKDSATPARKAKAKPSAPTLESVVRVQSGFHAAFWTEDEEAPALYVPVAALALVRDPKAGLIPASLVAHEGRWCIAEGEDRFLGVGFEAEDNDTFADAAARAAGLLDEDDDDDDDEGDDDEDDD